MVTSTRTNQLLTAPPKIECFAWLALQQRIATRHLLWSWGILPPGTSILCPLCSDPVKTVDHLLLHCEFAWRIWSSCLNWWGVSWVPPPSVSDMTSWWFDFNLKNLKKHICGSLFFAIIWNIWLCRNKKVFIDLSCCWSVVKELCKEKGLLGYCNEECEGLFTTRHCSLS